MNRYDALIASLSRDLPPVSRAPGVGMQASAWFLLSAAYVVAMTHLLGPVRPGAFSQLFSEPRFLLESLLGVVAIVWASLAAFRASVPAALGRRFATVGIVLMLLWIAQYAIGLADPALEPSTLGKRGHCYFETMGYSLPPIIAGLFLVRRLYPLRYVRTSMWIGLAAGMLPTLYMQLACMYEPLHILTLHVAPGLAMVLAAAVIAAVWRPRHQGPGRS